MAHKMSVGKRQQADLRLGILQVLDQVVQDDVLEMDDERKASDWPESMAPAGTVEND